jgi:hypothetical protein
MAVDDILHRHIEAFRQFGFEPRCHFRSDRFDKDDAVICHHESGDVIVHSRVVDVTRKLSYFLTFILRLLIQRPGLCPSFGC